VYVHVDPNAVELVKGFTRDVNKIGHWGTGDLKVSIPDKDSLVRAQPLIGRGYQKT
jgi:predicted transport protein